MTAVKTTEIFFGTPLPDDDDDVDSDLSAQSSSLAISRKRKLKDVEDYVLDEQGRRRFHGAFTGGFSAGYFNSVGTKEGWQPTAFVSSRQQRGSALNQKPEQYMDDEDLDQFGIAPRSVTVKNATGNNAAERTAVSGLSHGEAALLSLLAVRKSTTGERIMLSMGWRAGGGIGPRSAASVAINSQNDIPAICTPLQAGVDTNKVSDVFGCALPPGFVRKRATSVAPLHVSANVRTPLNSVTQDADELADNMVVWGLAPADVEALDFTPKTNRHGIGYNSSLLPLLSSSPSSLTGTTVAPAVSAVNLFSGERGHINLFGDQDNGFSSDRGGKNSASSTTAPTAVHNAKKKLGMRGQAFGVGALEDDDDAQVYDDEDSLHADKLSKYKFSLQTANGKPSSAVANIPAIEGSQKSGTISGFVFGKQILLPPAASEVLATFVVPYDWKPVGRTDRQSLTLPANSAKEEMKLSSSTTCGFSSATLAFLAT